MLLTRADAEDLMRRVLALTGAPACLVWLDGHEERNIRYASRGGATNGSAAGMRAVVTCAFGQRQGRATAHAFDEASLRDAVARAEAAARLAPENPEVMPPLGPQQYPANAAHVDATAALTITDVADLLAPGVGLASRSGVDIAAFARVTRSWRAFATSGGAMAYDRATRIGLTVSARNRRGTWSGWAGGDANDVARLDAEALARTAIDKALAQPDPMALDPGKYVVLLEPAVVGQFVSTMMWRMGARSAEEGRSFLTRGGGGTKLGERLFDEQVTITSDPADADAPGYGLSFDGLPNRPVTWVRDGRVETLTRNRYWAQKTGTEPVPEPGFFNMRGGSDTVTDMIRDVKRGVLVTRLWYVRMVSPRALLITGLTRDGTFLIENGAVSRPISNFRLNESPVALLGNVLALGPSRRTFVPESGAVLSVPPVLAKDFTFSSISPAV